MAGPGISSPARVRLLDLVPLDGLPSERYKYAVSALSQSLARYNLVIIQLAPGDDILLRCVLDSSRMFFHQRQNPVSESLHAENLQDWNKTVGYCSQPQHAREFLDYRPGAAAGSDTELSPACLPELFSCLGKASRHVLDAIGCFLELRSFSFADLLDNIPLKNGEISTSVLSICCHGRPGVHGAVHLSEQDPIHMPVFNDPEPQADKGLLTLLRADKPGLQIRDSHGRWFLADGDLGPEDMILYAGLSLYQATAGYISPALHRTEMSSSSQGQMYGRCSVAFKLMPRATAILHCSRMTMAGHVVGGPFQQPVSAHEFMQRSHSMDQILDKLGISNLSVSASLEGPPKALKRRKQVSKGKPLAPSKRLRLEAQRVLKERVQNIADRKGLKLRFCSLRDCEGNHLSAPDSQCALMRAELGWPTGVPFVHPHDLPNKAKQAFLEAYEPGWTAFQDGELGLAESAPLQSHHSHALTGAPLTEDSRFAVRTVYDYLRAKGRPVPSGKPQVAGHKVDLSSLAKASYNAGGRAQVENGSDKEKERALGRLKKLYDQVLHDYVEDLVASGT
ncbi:hypothetical protein O6H91_12G057900 [Diphasiastrum complanatum]|uniref:Uncharacterized protein n=1 Tax=Diphasiastrum complanatum TaxID=34168 RepID=A0ACC2C3C8_DIPCM|nr:hypothetical protein O6H91_Y489900 [Diphasiastrum complanatum]KAJ7536147.1 hypothetical protein O6H91_12G057900 [Diphasiastrum complanatum]